jgi:hypothetical protein
MSRILVAFDYFAPNYPVLNNQNFDVPLTKLHVDNGTYEFFNNLNGFECVPSLSVREMDYFIYPVRLGLNPDDWIHHPEADLLAGTNMSIHTFNGIRGRNGFLFLDLGNESILNDKIIDTIHEYLKLKDIPLRKVILQTGNANGEKYYKEYCFRKQISRGMNICCLEYFEWMVSRLIVEHQKLKRDVLPKNIDYTKIEKTFLCLNRVHRWHRVNLFLLWNVNDLMQDSYYTMNDKSNLPIGLGYDTDIWKNMVDVNLIHRLGLSEESIDDIYKTLPLKIDEFIGASEMAGLYSAVDPYYQTSLISVVTETNFQNNDIFNTEKIFKPMVHRHPFILVGPYKTLEHLKDMGYKTFSDFWDESYDDIEDPFERLLKIVEICKDIQSWDDIKKKQFFYKSMIITNHNYALLKSQYPDNMRKNFWHRLRDYVTFQQDKDKPI